ncbi:hypothetical protein [Haliangium sp.]|uniref:hypothetical protein n=1 Tax=Haliangium sp. TaxID=2663208 RepID=UPI003D10E449
MNSSISFALMPRSSALPSFIEALTTWKRAPGSDRCVPRFAMSAPTALRLPEGPVPVLGRSQDVELLTDELGPVLALRDREQVQPADVHGGLAALGEQEPLVHEAEAVHRKDDTLGTVPRGEWSLARPHTPCGGQVPKIIVHVASTRRCAQARGSQSRATTE